MGASGASQRLGRALARHGHHVTAIGMYLDPHIGAEDDDGVRVVRLSRSRIPLARFVWNRMKLAGALRSLSPRRQGGAAHARGPLSLRQVVNPVIEGAVGISCRRSV